MNNNTLGARMMNAKSQHLAQQNAARAAALHRFNTQAKRQKQTQITGSMLLLFALILANVWAARYGWGLL
jgi:uncharacterized membrane protein